MKGSVIENPQAVGLRRSWRFAGTPVDGTTLAGVADPGDLLIDTDNKKIYVNTNNKASPIWSQVLTGGVDFGEDLDFSGSHDDHILDFSGATFTEEKQVIRAGSYGSPIALQPSGGLIYMYGSQSGDTGVSAITFFYGVTTGDGGMIGESTLVESDAESPGPRTLQGGQFIAGLKSGAYLRTLGGDATAGMYGIWAKVHAAGDSIASSGSRIAAIWLDNQMQGTVSGEEYSAFITTGGSKPKAVFGFETTGAGWTNLFYFDETCYTDAPVGATRGSPNQTATCDGSLTVLINDKTLLIPLYNAVDLAS